MAREISGTELAEAQARVWEEVVQPHPKGVFFYYCSWDEFRPEIQEKLSGCLPEWYVVVVGDRLGYFFADFGTWENNQFIGYKQNQEHFPELLASQSQISGDAFLPYLPTFVTDPTIVEEGWNSSPTSYAGGYVVEVGNSGVSFTTSSQIAELRKDAIYLPKFKEALKRAESDMCIPKNERRLYFGHPDILMTAIDVPNTQGQSERQVFVDECIYERMSEYRLIDPELRSAIMTRRYCTSYGGLNIQYIDNFALVSSIEYIDEKVVEAVGKAGLEIVELGKHQANTFIMQAGVKCRSLTMPWRDNLPLSE